MKRFFKERKERAGLKGKYSVLLCLIFPAGHGYVYLRRPGLFLIALFGHIFAALVGLVMGTIVGYSLCLEPPCTMPNQVAIYLAFVGPWLFIIVATSLHCWSLADSVVEKASIGWAGALNIVPGFGAGYLYMHRTRAYAMAAVAYLGLIAIVVPTLHWYITTTLEADSILRYVIIASAVAMLWGGGGLVCAVENWRTYRRG